MRFGGPYHNDKLLDIELLCRLTFPKHTKEAAGAVTLLPLEGYLKIHQQLNKEDKC